MSQHHDKAVQRLSSLHAQFNEQKRKLQHIEAKYEMLQVDWSSVIIAMRSQLSTDSSDTNKLSQIDLLVETFPERYLTRETESDSQCTATSGTIVDHGSASVSNCNLGDFE